MAKKLISYNEDADEGDRLPAQVRTEIEIVASNTTIGSNHYLIWNTGTSAWPVRPADDLPVIWVGGAAPTNAPTEQRAGDVWIPASGDGTPLGATLEALQLIAATGSRIPYFPSNGVAGLLTLSTDGTLAANSDTVIVTQKSVKTYADAAVAAAAATLNTAITTVTPNPQTGTTYTLALTDVNKVVEMNNASANTLTVPPNTSIAIPVNSVVEVVSLGAGQTTIAAGVGVTIRSSSGKLKLTGQYSAATLRKRATDEWVLVGDLST